MFLIYYIRKVISKAVFVMVNFACEPDWAMGNPDMWLKMILSVSWGVFSMRLHLNQLTE